MRDKVRWRGGKKGMKVMGKEGKSGSHEKKKMLAVKNNLKIKIQKKHIQTFHIETKCVVWQSVLQS